MFLRLFHLPSCLRVRLVSNFREDEFRHVIRPRVHALIQKSRHLRGRRIEECVSESQKPEKAPLYVAIDLRTRIIVGFILLLKAHPKLRKRPSGTALAWYVNAVGIDVAVRELQRQLGKDLPLEQRLGVRLIRRGLRHAVEHPPAEGFGGTGPVVFANIDNDNHASMQAFTTACRAEGWRVMNSEHNGGAEQNLALGIGPEQPQGGNFFILYRDDVEQEGGKWKIKPKSVF